MNSLHKFVYFTLLCSVFGISIFQPISAYGYKENDSSKVQTDNNADKTVTDIIENQNYSGWVLIDGSRYYYKKGKMLKHCWLTRKGERIAYLDKIGKAAVGKVTISGTEYEFDENGIIITDNNGLSLSITNDDPENFTVLFTISNEISNKEYTIGDDYKIERLSDNNTWEEAQYKDTSIDYIFGDIADTYIKSFERTYNISIFDLTPGRYRFSTDIEISDANKEWEWPDYDTSKNNLNVKIYYVYFDVE